MLRTDIATMGTGPGPGLKNPAGAGFYSKAHVLKYLHIKLVDKIML